MTDLEKSHLSKQCYRLIWDGQGLQSVERLLAEHSDVTPDVNKEISAEAELWLISYKLAIQKREQHLIKGLISDVDIQGPLGRVRVGGVEDAKNYVVKNRIDIVYCALGATRRDDITDLMEFCERNTIRFRVIPSGESFIPVVKTSSLEFHGSVPVSKLRKEPLDRRFNRALKRTFDFLFYALVILFVFTWLFPVLAVLVKLSSKGPVFFKQMRLGRDNKQFACWKFGSMQVNKEADSVQATKNDPRVILLTCNDTSF